MSISLAPGEMGYTVSKGVPTLVKGPYEGPGFPLTKLVADAYDYMEGEDPSGSIKSEIGPVTKFVTDAGMCPISGTIYKVKAAFNVVAGQFISTMSADGTKAVVLGPKLYAPPTDTVVLANSWSDPLGSPDPVSYTFVPTTPTRTTFKVGPLADNLVKDVTVTWFAVPEKFSTSTCEDFFGELASLMLVDITKYSGDVAAMTAKDFPSIAPFAKKVGFTIDGIAPGGTSPAKGKMSSDEKSALLMLAQKYQMESELQTMIAMQEVDLAGNYALLQNQVMTYQQMLEIQTNSKWDIAAMGNEAMGSDKSMSKVVACCCCSVAKKQSGGIWASVNLGGSASLAADWVNPDTPGAPIIQTKVDVTSSDTGWVPAPGPK